LSYLAVAKALLKTVRYDDSEYSYICEMDDRPVKAKKRIAPLLATGL